RPTASGSQVERRLLGVDHQLDFFAVARRSLAHGCGAYKKICVPLDIGYETDVQTVVLLKRFSRQSHRDVQEVRMIARSSSLRSIFCSFMVICLCAVSAHAQYSASLQGTVTDPSGAAVQGATVTVTNQATRVTANLTTNDTGFYRAAQLPPGNYTVAVT